MTQQEETQKDEHIMGDMQERSTEDFESLMIKRKAKQQMKESTWSEVEVKDVQVYSGYEFADAKMVRQDNASATVRGTIAGDEPVQSILDDMNDGTRKSYRTKAPRFTHADGAIVHDGSRYLYRKRRWIIVTVESPDGSYSKDYVVTRTPKFEDNNLEDVYKQVVKDLGSGGSIGSPPDSKREYLRTDKILDSTNSNMIAESVLRMGVMGTSILTGFFGAVAIMAATGSLMLGTIFLATIVFTASYIQQNMYDGWFEIAPMDWIDELPESAKITDNITKEMSSEGFESSRETRLEFMNSDADVEVEPNGTLKIKTPMAEWVFDAEDDGIPSEKAEMLYQSYGGINFTETDTIPVQIAQNDERVPLDDGQFESKDGSWVLRADGI